MGCYLKVNIFITIRNIYNIIIQYINYQMTEETEFGDMSIDDMIDNMGKPTTKRIECPIQDCHYKNKVKSVAAHVSASDLDAHIWENTEYDGWKDFINKKK